MTENQNSPLFAGRYRFEPVGNDWDRGRSGYTHLVYDLKEKRLGVIKRAETKSSSSVEGLKNEVTALRLLKGLGVPEVYDTGQAEHGSKIYDYVVIEYIDELRVEWNLKLLSVSERKQIITELFNILAHAHEMGIVNGDIDLKHLFWRKDKKQLVVIDWGNARLGVDMKKESEFAYDLARAAEIIFSLVTLQSNLPATGEITLPDGPEIVSVLGSLPIELRNLCRWAPRTPSAGAHSPYTAKELYEVSKKWLLAVNKTKLTKSPLIISNTPRILLLLIVLFGILSFLLLSYFTPKTFFPFPVIENSLIVPVTPSYTSNFNPVATNTAIISTTISPFETIIPPQVITPLPNVYSSQIITFDKSLGNISCWKNEALSPAKLILNDGFYRRTDLDWGFRVQENHTTDEIVQVDFTSCLNSVEIKAFALNVAINRLQPEIEKPLGKDGNEFGFYLEGSIRREYTIWIDKGRAMHLRIREDNKIIYDEIILVVSSSSLHSADTYPVSYKFPLIIFFEIDNQGLDILYMIEGSLEKSINVGSVDPLKMIRIDSAVRQTVDNLQGIGLLGRGGKTEVQIWPLVFFEK